MPEFTAENAEDAENTKFTLSFSGSAISAISAVNRFFTRAGFLPYAADSGGAGPVREGELSNRVRICLRACLCAQFAVAMAAGQQLLRPDLSRAKVFNRGVTAVEEEGKKGIRVDERAGDGILWFEGTQFSNGVIEVDLKGKDVFQKSFLGVVFRGVDEKTFDAVYFRPFNFRSAEPARRVHAVQYISHPDFTWMRLRKERPEVFEKAVSPVPDPERWFHARIVVQRPKVSVFVNGASEPSLVVDELSSRAGGWVGLFVGNGSGGAFANLEIRPDK